MKLSPDLSNRYLRILLDSGICDSDERLRTLFRGKIETYRNFLRQCNNPVDRANQLIDLLDGRTIQGHLVLLIVLENLRPLIPNGDDQQRDLDQLCGEIEIAYFFYKNLLLSTPENKQHQREQLKNLVKITRYLYETSAMRDRNRHREILRLLPFKMQDVVNNDNASDFMHVLDIVKRCDDDLPYGPGKLVDLLYEENDPQRQTLYNLLNSYRREAITYDKFKELQRTLIREGWTTYDILRKAYNISKPEMWEPLRLEMWKPLCTGDIPSADFLPAILDNLITAPQQPICPMLVFVQYFAYYAQRHQKADLHIELDGWVKERARALGLNSDQITAIRKKAGRDTHADAYHLLLAIESPCENSFNFQAWFLDSHNNPILNVETATSDNLLSLEEIQNLLNDLLKTWENHLSESAEPSKLIIEFALPSALLYLPIDQWLVDVGLIKAKVGILHKVVVRSLDRINRRDMHARWRRKWAELQTENVSACGNEDHILVCDENQYTTAESIFSAIHGSSAVCLALTYSPLDHLITAALAAGTPIMLWPRTHTGLPDTMCNFYRDRAFLAPNLLPSMHEIVWQQRVEAGTSDQVNHQGHHLTLLRDDPNRLLPRAPQFTMPS